MHNRNKTGGWGWLLTTNGYLLKNKDIRDRLYRLTEFTENNMHGDIQISFDVTGQYRRVIKNTDIDTYTDILNVIQSLDDENRKYHISYTITSSNINTYKKDIVWMMLNFKMLDRLTINIARAELESIWGNNTYYSTFLYEISIFSEAVFLKYKKSICELVCDICNKCNKIEKTNHYLIPQKGILKKNKHTLEKFNQF